MKVVLKLSWSWTNFAAPVVTILAIDASYFFLIFKSHIENFYKLICLTSPQHPHKAEYAATTRVFEIKVREHKMKNSNLNMQSLISQIFVLEHTRREESTTHNNGAQKQGLDPPEGLY